MQSAQSQRILQVRSVSCYVLMGHHAKNQEPLLTQSYVTGIQTFTGRHLCYLSLHEKTLQIASLGEAPRSVPPETLSGVPTSQIRRTTWRCLLAHNCPCPLRNSKKQPQGSSRKQWLNESLQWKSNKDYRVICLRARQNPDSDRILHRISSDFETVDVRWV